jgi:hypothetical protein
LAVSPTWDQETLLNALKDDLAKLRHSQFAPSLVVFSGDLAQSGGVNGAYESVLGYLISVLEALNLSEDRLIVCPGNHDASRDVIGPRLPDLAKWRSKAADTGGANTLAIDPDFKAYVGRNFECFEALTSQFAQAAIVRSDHFSTTYFFRDAGVAVVALNTALLSDAGLITGSEDRGQLCVPERALVEAIEAAPHGIPVLVIGHHPSSWLNDSNRAVFERVLSKHAAVYFSGHLHEAEPVGRQGLLGSYLHVQAGALYSHRSYWNGYALLSFETENGFARIAYRRWFEARREFSKAEDLVDDGVFFAPAEAKAYWAALAPPLDCVALERWRNLVLLPELAGECNSSLSNQSLETVFVKPEFERDVPFRQESDGQMGSRVETLNFSQVVAGKENLVISAQGETGKSTFLKQLALSLARREFTGAQATIPVLISFGPLKPYVAQIETAIRRKLPELPGDITLKMLLEAGSLAILVDDVDFASADKRKALIAFVLQYPKCRYIFTSSTTFVESSALKPEIVPAIPFTRVRMRPIKNSGLLSIIESHGTTDPLKADRMLERVVREASALNVPLTAVTGTFLIQIIQNDPDHTTVNQAALIERYLEMLLQKFAPKELLPGTFDFKNKVDLLCAISENMVRESMYSPDENQVMSWCVNYLKGYGLDFSAKDLIEYFIKARIFVSEGGTLRFRLRMFFEFFVATRMIDDEPFRNYIFDEKNYLQFIHEIGFYAAINRRDHVQLKRLFENFELVTKEAWPDDAGRPTPDDYLESFVMPNMKTSEEELGALLGQMKSNALLEEERQDLLEGANYEEGTSNQTVTRQEFATPQERWLGHLILISGMVKHMELIPDWEKRKYVSGIIGEWVRFAATSLSIVSVLAEKKRVTFNGITYMSTLDEKLSVGDLARRLALTMPTAAARMATVFLGTEKLRLQLLEGIGPAGERPARQVMRLSILADLGADNVPELAEKTAESARGHRFLEHVLARKLYEVAVRFRLAKVDLNRLRSLVGEMFVTLESTPGPEAASRKATVLKGMSKQRVLIDYRLGRKR